jgi:SPP1 gp7 family putative phage head morphogenesis protein
MERQPASIFNNCPWENHAEEKSIIKNNEIFEIGVKAQSGVATAFEQTREGNPKAYIPNFFYKPPFGYPRYKDLNYYRQLAASIYVDMCETAIIDEVCSVPWDIVAEDEAGNEVIGKEKEVEKIRAFFDNPNTNKESWETIVRMMLPDLIEINSGIIVKTFNAFGEMVEIVARDGASFTKNPDIYGMYTDRADMILLKNIMDNQTASDQTASNQNFQLNTDFQVINGSITDNQAREEAAYFQYGWNTGAKPVPFGKREIVWFEKKVRTDDHYGRSAMEVLSKTVQTLIYAVEHNLEYFSDNSIPPGVLGLDGMSTEDVKAFASQWIESQKKQDELGNWKKAFHKLPTVNKMPKFERLGFTNAELELIDSQKWWAKMVWGALGLTSTDLGFTEDAKGNANQIVQTSVGKKRIIYPLLRLIEYHVNTEIIPEFGVKGIKYKYKIFDVDEETKKWTLYKIQTESSLKTINEIRNAEGLDPIEGGDDTPKNNQNKQTEYSNPANEPMATEYNRTNRDNQEERDKQTNKPKEKKDIKIDEKATDTRSPTILGPFEEMDENKLKKVIVELLKENEEQIINILDSQSQEEQLIKIKSIDDIPKMIKKIFKFFTFKSISDNVIKVMFSKGWEQTEKKINMNVLFNEKALEFLQSHTFDNIKGMTEEIANDLKAELERGIINGESIAKLKDRVRSVFNVGEVRAEMISRTESNRAENNGKLLAMKGSGKKYKKKWLSAHDNRTSELCKHLDGQTVEIDEDFHYRDWDGQSPPAHVNCRSSIIFVEED